MLPVGVPLPESAVTAAVNVTESPYVDGFRLEVTAVVVVMIWTVVLWVAELLEVFGSAVAEVTEAVLVSVPAEDGAVTVIVMVELVLGARLAFVQLRLLVPVQVQPEAETLW